MINVWKGTAAQKKKAGPSEYELLVADIRECEMRLRQNEQIFNLKSDEKIIDAIIYEREALLSRHSYLMALARGMRAEEKAAAQPAALAPTLQSEAAFEKVAQSTHAPQQSLQSAVQLSFAQEDETTHARETLLAAGQEG